MIVACDLHVVTMLYPLAHRFEVVEAAAGAPKLFAASIPAGKTGPQVCAGLGLGFTLLGFTLRAATGQMSRWMVPSQKSDALLHAPGRRTARTEFKCCQSYILPLRCYTLQLIRDLMDDAVANGLNLMRFFALPVDQQYSIQPVPGQFNEAVFRGLDYALDQARQHGIKVRCR